MYISSLPFLFFIEEIEIDIVFDVPLLFNIFSGSSTSAAEGKMQNTKDNSTNLGAVRVYPPGSKRLGKKLPAVHQSCGDTSDINGDTYTRPSTSYKIDLPFHELDANISQALDQNSIVLPLPSFEKKSGVCYAHELQTKPSSELFSNEYSKVTVLRDSRNSLQDSKAHRDELQVCTTRSNLGPTRISHAPQNIVALKDKGSHHGGCYASRDATCKEEKERNSGRKKPPNADKLNRPQHQIVKFLEDYAEFGDDLKEIFEGRGRYCPTVLESTVDGSIVKGARRFVA